LSPISQRAKRIGANYELYLFFLPTLIYFLLFHYGPMYGVQIAFKDFIAVKGITGSPWTGLKHFRRFFNSFQFWILLRNTVFLSFYQLAAGFPIPILLALLLNQVKISWFKRTVQTVTYAPHFISVVVMVGMLNVFLSVRSGLFNHFIRALGGEAVYFMAKPELFRDIYVWSGVWQNAGWGTIIYLAALSGIDPQLHEAAIVDGATKLQRIRHIDIPGIIPTAIVLLILNMGRVMRLGFEKAFLMQNPLNVDTSEIIPTYVYKVGLLSAQYSFSAAVGLFNSIINLTLLVAVNRLARKFGETSLW
jgi:putative aldouronate transport system permease protein